jgi:hypothetical protein
MLIARRENREPGASLSATEAAVFARYVVNRDITPAARDLYGRAKQKLGYDNEDRTTSFAIEHPWSIPALDGALALLNPDGLLRKRLLLMAAILETQPEYCDAFLPRDRSRWEAFGIAYAIVRAALQAALGFVLLRVVR